MIKRNVANTREYLLYDLAADPAERRPNADLDAPNDLDTLAQRVLDEHGALGRSRDLPTRGLDEVSSEALRALGYLEE